MANSRIVGVVSEGLFINPGTNKETRVLSGKYKNNNKDVLFFVKPNGDRELITIGDLLNEWLRV